MSKHFIVTITRRQKIDVHVTSDNLESAETLVIHALASENSQIRTFLDGSAEWETLPRSLRVTATRKP